MKGVLRLVALLEGLGLVGFGYFAYQEYRFNDYFRAWVLSGAFFADPLLLPLLLSGAMVVGIALMDPPLKPGFILSYLKALRSRTRRLETTNGEGAMNGAATAPRGKGPGPDFPTLGPTGAAAGHAVPAATPESVIPVGVAAKIQNRIAAAAGSPRDNTANSKPHTGPSAVAKLIQNSRKEWIVNQEA